MAESPPSADKHARGSWFLVSADGAVERAPHVKQEWLEQPDSLATILFVDAGDHAPPGQAAITAARPGAGQMPRFAFLLNRLAPPGIGVRNDGEVESYLCSPTLYADICDSCGGIGNYSAYQAIQALLGLRARPVRLSCLQFPQVPAVTGQPADLCEWIIPHAGDLKQLDTCLGSVCASYCRTDTVSICFDEELSDRHRLLAQRFPRFRFFESRPYANGPYVSRHRLAQQSTADYLVFQDSDDVSCTDRRARLLHAIAQRKLDWVGSHELQIDEINGRVQAFRFPLDVNGASSKRAGHPLLFPTSIIRRASLLRAGGFSTHRTFGSDTELLLRAYFFELAIGNVDEFLYIRRKRHGSLTTAPASALGSPIRHALDKSWKSAFQAIKGGRLPLADSPLRHTHHLNYADIEIEAMTLNKAQAAPE